MYFLMVHLDKLFRNTELKKGDLQRLYIAFNVVHNQKILPQGNFHRVQMVIPSFHHVWIAIVIDMKFIYAQN